ncbi:MAG TPA: ribbon-helix-helix protein, CopG family [Candidatus Faecalibacterium faecipullorum]|uniref:Ribbon-helix-helix protein, CopG family n=1 Tax=Candidatus Faecalibacterium faecipullorum TaxID=2838578 RepID=A0A9D2MG90_9FIRM|nr:ribbon-helix-helix protein, CopG family [Candidatus Faecalibacterium faecipullorum]
MPKKTTEKENVSIRIPLETLEQVDAKAAAIGISRNQLLNQCIEYALANMAEDGEETEQAE